MSRPFNYKSLIKSRNVRIWIMNLLRFVPDKLMLSIQYKIKTGRQLNWKNPERFTEKLQLYKIWQKNHPELNRCADKFDVRSFVREQGLEEILNPLAGGEKAYSSPDEIDWEGLPNQFVLKDTLGGGGNAVIVCTDKQSFDIEKAKETCRKWVSDRRVNAGREHVYDGRAHRIIIERYMADSDGDLPDYKFYCFNGVCFCYYVRNSYMKNHKGFVSFYDRNDNLIPNLTVDYCALGEKIEMPKNITEMKLIAEKLAQDFPHVRVDLYSLHEKIYFGELTFFNASGYFHFSIDEFDFIMGKEFSLPNGEEL